MAIQHTESWRPAISLFLLSQQPRLDLSRGRTVVRGDRLEHPGGLLEPAQLTSLRITRKLRRTDGRRIPRNLPPSSTNRRPARGKPSPRVALPGHRR